MTAVGVWMMALAAVVLMGGLTVVGFVEGGTLVGCYVVVWDVLLAGFTIACVGMLDS